MKYIVSIVLFVVLLSFQSFAQAPNSWKVDPGAFNNTMTMVGIIKVDRKDAKSVNDKVAAFVNGECRGVASLVEQSSGKFIAYLLVYHNGETAKVNFKFYSAEKNMIYNAIDTVRYVVDSLAGDVNLPYVWSNVRLNREAEFKTFSFFEQVHEAQYRDSSIYLAVKENTNLSKLVALFNTSDGASVWIDNKQQSSGTTHNNFGQPVKYTVYSEDGQHKKEYWVKVGAVMGTEDVKKAAFAVYPNPTSGTLYINLASQESSLKLSFATASGQNYTKQALRDATTSSYKVEVSDLSPGVYFLSVTNFPKIGVRKVVIR